MTSPGGSGIAPPAHRGRVEESPLPARDATRPPGARPHALRRRAGGGHVWLALLLCLVSGLVCLLGLEVAARRALAGSGVDNGQSCAAPGWCGPSRAVREPHPVLRWENRPLAIEQVPLAEHPDGQFVFRTNAQALRRDTDVAVPKPAGVFRILVLGDSQTEGYVNNDEHYPHVLETRLRAAGLEHVEVLNAGVGAYEAAYYYYWYLVHGVSLEPDLVLVGLYLGNDLGDLNPPTAVREDDHGDLVYDWGLQARHYARLARGWLLERSWLLGGVADGRLSLALPGRGPDARITPGLRRVLADCLGCWYQHFAQGPWTDPRRVEAVQGTYSALLARLHGQVARHGSRLVLVPIPSKAMIEPGDDPAAMAQARTLLGLTDEELASFERTHDIALAAALAADVPVADPWLALATAAQHERLYYRRDWHLTPAGHRALGEFLADTLLHQGLVPPGS